MVPGERVVPDDEQFKHLEALLSIKDLHPGDRMKVFKLPHTIFGSQLLTVSEGRFYFQYIGARQHCICGSQTSRYRNNLLSVNTAVTNVQKRTKVQEQQSSLGMYFGKKKKLPRNQTLLKEVSDGIEIIKKGIPQYKDEWLERLAADKDIFPVHGDFEYFQRFNGEESLKDWLLTTDQDTGQGKSKATWKASATGSAILEGYLNTEVPKDGISKRAGYCNIRSPLNKISFERHVPYDWSRYTHVYLKVRGDGRNYMLILQMERHFDIHMFDLYNYPIYTRGGPYWQIVKIPFSYFYLSCQGRAQDQQELMNLDKIKFMGISAGDGVKGPFRLEIDYIALVTDNLFDNERDFKYELYRKQRFEI